MTTIQGPAKRDNETQGPSWQAELVFRDWKDGLEAARANWAGAPVALKPNLLLQGNDLTVATSWLHTRIRDLTPQQQSFIRKSIARSYNSAIEQQRHVDAHRKSQIKWMISFGATVSAFVLFIGMELALYHVWRTMNPGSTIFNAQDRAPFSLPGPSKQVVAAPEIATQPVEQPAESVIAAPVEISAPPEPLEIARPVVEPPSAEDRATPRELALKALDEAETGDPMKARLIALEALSEGVVTLERDDLLGPAVDTLQRVLLTRRSLSGTTGAGATRTISLSRNAKLAVMAGGDLTAKVADLSTLRAGAAGPSQMIHREQTIVGIDDSAVALTGRDDTVQIWPAGAAQPAAVLRGHEAGVTTLAFNRDRSKAATTSWDETLRIWDAHSGRGLMVLLGHEGPVLSAAFDATGTRLVSAGEDRTARLWSTADGRQTAILRGHLSVVTSAEFDPSGRRVLTTSLDGTARLWDATTGILISSLAPGAGYILNASFGHSPRRVAALTNHGEVLVWNAADGSRVSAIAREGRKVRSYGLGGDNDLLLILGTDGAVSLFNSSSGAEAMTYVAPGGQPVVSSGFADNGAHILAVTDEQNVFVWPVHETVAGLVAHAMKGISRCLSADERRELNLEPAIPRWCAEAISAGKEN